MQPGIPGLQTETFTAKAQRRKGNAKESKETEQYDRGCRSIGGDPIEALKNNCHVFLCVPFASLRLKGYSDVLRT